jgi:two-component system response regulator NreC
MRVALVDDHQMFRDGLRAILGRERDLEVVGEAESARQAYQLLEETAPELVLVDVSLPGSSGITLTREIKRRQPRCKVLILTVHAEAEYVSLALAAGASGYALKNQSARELIEAIRTVAAEGTYLCPRISGFVVDNANRLRRGEPPPSGPCDALSTREREVFELLVRGYTNERIATELCISVKTVETHRAHILKKLQVHSMVDLVRFAARHSLLTE